MNITRLNELLKELPGEVDLSKKDDKMTAKMRFGLAQAYAIDGFREYMELAIRTANESYDIVEDMNSHIYVKSKKLTMKNLLNLSKNCFLEAQKLDKSNRGLQD